MLVWQNPTERALDGALGFAAGVMLAAAFTNLIILGIKQYSGSDPVPHLVGVAFGIVFLDRADGPVLQSIFSNSFSLETTAIRFLRKPAIRPSPSDSSFLLSPQS